MNRILVSMESYLNYKNKYGTDKLDENNSIWAPSKSIFYSNKINEIFDGIETDYEINNVNNGYKITFLSKSNTEYRFDLIKDPNNNVYHLGFIKDVDTYEKITDKHESFDVFNKLIWILKDVSNKLSINEFCIGETGNDKKDRIYQAMMKFVKEWEMKKTKHYKTGWGIYFKL